MIPYRQEVKADVFEASIARSIRATETNGSLLPEFVQTPTIARLTP